MKKIITKNEKETIGLAKKYAKTLKGGEIIGLSGDLGSGKTIFAKGLAVGFKIKRNITSPTFVVMKVYPVTDHPTINTFVHIDAYRLEPNTNISEIGIDEYLNRADTVIVIEWPENIIKFLPKSSKLININNQVGNKRLITLN